MPLNRTSCERFANRWFAVWNTVGVLTYYLVILLFTAALAAGWRHCGL
jgi:hypothetical protein